MNPGKLLLNLSLTLVFGTGLLIGQTPAPSERSSAKPAAAPEPKPTIAAAQTKLEHGEIDEALADLNRLKTTDPATPGLDRALGVAYFRKGDFAAATPSLEKVTKDHPDDKEAVQLLGLSYYYLGRTQDSIPLLEKVHDWFPEANVDASYVLGISYLRINDYDKARKSFAEMYDTQPDSAASHLILARMLLREGYDPVAEKELLKAAELDPKLPGVHLFLGELYTYKSQMEKAIDELKAELKVNPVNAEALYKLADAYSRVQQWDDAQRLLQRSIWLDSTSTGPYVLMAKVLLKRNEPLLSSRAAQKAIEMDHNNYFAHYMLGQALVKMGKIPEAQAEIRLSQQLQTKQSHSVQELQTKKPGIE